jgi:extracellular factor (EF) 3-hydroxypalmitic acid methyl ester biosynthesis protein
MSEKTLRLLSADDWGLICASASQLQFKPGDEIIPEGSTRQIIYVLRRGTVKVEILEDGRRVEIGRIRTGEFFGEMAFVEDVAASARALAEDHVEVDAIASAELYSLFESFPGLATRFYQTIAQTLSKRLRHVTAQLLDARAKAAAN